MNSKEFNQELHIIDKRASILDALNMMNAITDGVMTLIVTKENGIVDGTVTDGDIRRAFLKGATLESTIARAANRNFCSIGPDGPVWKIKEARRKGIRLLPVLDGEGRLLRMLDLTRVDTMLPLSAILMAGGKGERLRPMTLKTPKPLLEIGGMPIIDYNVRNLSRAGITDVTVTARYLAQQIIDHFSRPELRQRQNPSGTE